MNRILILLTALLFISNTPLLSQTEAEGTTEALVFQQKEGPKKISVQPGDRLRVHQNEDRANDVVGEVVAIHENSLEIFTKSTGKKYIVDLRQVEGLSSPRARTNSTGLIISGATLSILFLISAFLSASTTAFFGPVLFLFSVAFFLVGLALLLAGLSRRNRMPKILLKLWTWRLVRKRKVIVKKKKP